MTTGGTVELFWIPLGAGGHSVRCNGIVYEAIAAAVHRRPRCDLVHSALCIGLPDGRFTVEMTPVPDRFGDTRGVVATGPVGSNGLSHLRVFRYEVRRWRDGVIPDIGAAVGGPVRITSDLDVARRIYDAVPEVPTLVWGRDELHTGDMWSCNSITSWALTTAGVDVGAITLPEHTRAPGWAAGTIAATRRASRRSARLPRGTRAASSRRRSPSGATSPGARRL
jgi:hypothetical protein